jgi:hypothetical protein
MGETAMIIQSTASLRKPGSIVRLLLIPACAGILLAGFSAHAEDKVFTQPGCEFQMTFPEIPASSQICNPNKPKECHHVAVFNKVYALDSAMRITVTCTSAEPGMLERYDQEALQYTLAAIAKPHLDDDGNTGYQDLGAAKQAMIMGSHKMGDGTETIYMAQLWIGKKSVYTIEGEITGSQVPEADTLFAHIMKSATLVPDDKPASNADEKKDGQKDGKTEEKPVAKQEK